MATILLIDDDVTLLASLGLKLEDAGYRVLKASDTSHAALLVVEESPDIAVLEVRIGRDAGWRLLKEVVPLVPVIVLSASGREEDIVRGLAAGAIDYISKPYRTEELLARLRVRLTQVARPVLAPPGVAPGSPPEASPHPEPVPAPPALAPIPRQQPAPPAEPASRPEPALTFTASANGVEHDQDEGSPFMSEAEEMALLRMSVPVMPAREQMLLPETNGQLTLGKQFKLERQRRRLTLVQAESELKIPMSYLQAIEDDKFTLLPRGPLSLQIVRKYADYLSLPTGELVQEFQQHHYTDAPDPWPALGGPHYKRGTPRWIAPVAGLLLALAISLGGLFYFDRDGIVRTYDAMRALVVPVSPPVAPPVPTIAPTSPPTVAPTSVPTIAPTSPPTVAPTVAPTQRPTFTPPAGNTASPLN